MPFERRTHFQNTMLAMVAIDDLASSVKPQAVY